MSSELERLIQERRLIRIKPDRKLILKEIEGAESDPAEARESLGKRKFKWATIQAYYSMFHSVRALVYSKGFREKSHHALLIALRHLFAREMESELVESFGDAMGLREEADYRLIFSEEGATSVIGGAEKFLNRAKSILKIG